MAVFYLLMANIVCMCACMHMHTQPKLWSVSTVCKVLVTGNNSIITTEMYHCHCTADEQRDIFSVLSLLQLADCLKIEESTSRATFYTGGVHTIYV